MRELFDKASTERRIELFFRDQFRNARAYAISDAEGLHEILFVLERLGKVLHPNGRTFNDYRDKIKEEAEKSPLASKIPELFRHLLISFESLYEIVRMARNDAFHQGAYARHLTSHAIELCLIMEDTLSKLKSDAKVTDFMVRGVICAELWQPIAFVRQQMLANNFSYLPLYESSEKKWYFISEASIAKALLRNEEERDLTLALKLGEAKEKNTIELISTKSIQCNKTVREVIDFIEQTPLLVFEDERLIGILSASDLM